MKLSKDAITQQNKSIELAVAGAEAIKHQINDMNREKTILKQDNKELKQSVNNLEDTIIKITIAYQRKYDRTIVDLVDEVGDLGSVHRFLAPILIHHRPKEGKEEQKGNHQKPNNRELGTEKPTEYQPQRAHFQIGFFGFLGFVHGGFLRLGQGGKFFFF